MKSRKLTCLTAMTLFALLALPVRLAAQEPHNNEHPRYRVRDLGTLGGTFSLAGGINNRGEVEGISTLPGDATEHAFVWRKGLMTDLGTLGGPNSGAAWRPSDRGRLGEPQTLPLQIRWDRIFAVLERTSYVSRLCGIGAC